MGTKKSKNNKRQEAIAKSVQKIAERAERRKERGRVPLDTDWQATLEIMLLMMEEPLREHPGQLLPMEISGQKEWDFYLEAQEKLDLPPDTCAVLITPNAFKQMSAFEPLGLEAAGLTPWQRNAYSVIISGCQDHTVVMQVSLPGLKSVGIDVYEDGKHFADYSYKTIEECLNELTRVTWTYFNPYGDWTEGQIIGYTENWFAKTIDLVDIENVKLHKDYSYVHHPELLSLTPLQSSFKVITATILRDYDSLEKAIEVANDLNQDLDLGDPMITKNGVLQDNESECQALLNRIVVEIDQHLDALEHLEGVEFPQRSFKDPDYQRVFDETARRIYEGITNRPCPKSLKIE